MLLCIFVLLATLVGARAESLSFKQDQQYNRYSKGGAYSCAKGRQLGLPVGNWPVGRVSNTLQEAIDGAYAQHYGSCEAWRVINPVDLMNAGFLTEDMDFLVCRGLNPTLSCSDDEVMFIWSAFCTSLHSLTGRIVRDPCTNSEYMYLNVETTETEAQGIVIPDVSACAIDNDFALCCDDQDPQVCRSGGSPPTPRPTPYPTPGLTPSPPVMNNPPPSAPTTPTVNNNSGGNPTSNNGAGGGGSTPSDIFNINLNQDGQQPQEDDSACNSDCVSAICSVLGVIGSGLLGLAGYRHQKKKREDKGDATTAAGNATEISFGGPVRAIWVGKSKRTQTGSSHDADDGNDISTIGGESIVRTTPPPIPQSSSALGTAVTDADSSATPKKPSKKKKKKKDGGDDVTAGTTAPKKKKKKKKRASKNLASSILAEGEDGVSLVASPGSIKSGKKKKKKRASSIVEEEESHQQADK